MGIERKIMKLIMEAVDSIEELSHEPNLGAWLAAAKGAIPNLKDHQLLEAAVTASPKEIPHFYDAALLFRVDSNYYSVWIGERGDNVIKPGKYEFVKAVTYIKKITEELIKDEEAEYFDEETIGKALVINIWKFSSKNELFDAVKKLESAVPKRLSAEIKDQDLIDAFKDEKGVE